MYSNVDQWQDSTAPTSDEGLRRLQNLLPDGEPIVCRVCGGATSKRIAQVTMWSGGQLVLIEDVPAHVCDSCEEQYYDEDTGAKILTLANAGFPARQATHEIRIPVFSIKEIVVPYSEEYNPPADHDLP